mmetsp:Transcript_16386/g.28018  ORF Transcript_16386/g.28018 Transcript_16386/m.28018 type:complete len:396 (-) Transcript_16386:137-1324(-)|eukprot:CAMPEP_0183707116 /NCGR_PEP_ID=MMETSP0737-20130205/3767_1 /TAXON_ID=385413 /ORGANISM="Thalassiosira miniscula, Strain CCMP1093" /LENGTH=395 /DNA_ID=CAMNT_0025934697 /DNA_START=113 /DNA_END=1303 /DNA_ORIENTATION=-
MPKRKRVESSPTGKTAAATGTTFSLMDGKVDVLQGLVMHKDVIDQEFENELISFVQTQCERGRRGELKKPTYLRASGARSQGNQREAIMYGGFFDFNRARPGKRGLVPPFPPILNKLVDHLISNNYLPSDVRPDSCIINQYDKGDCIPPHVDHQSYFRPISTLSLLGEEPMLVGTKFRTVKSCTWAPVRGKSVPLPRRSLLVLGGNSGNISKHCISACAGKRISITLRKQPPPDWKPDESELVSGKKTKKKGGKDQLQGKHYHRGDVKGVVSNGTREGNGNLDDGEQQSPKKKKALSGSAKRRKKMQKIMEQRNGGGSDQNKNRSSSSSSIVGNAKEHGIHSNIVEKGSKGGGGGGAPRANKGENEMKKKNAKQARRNARRLEKKKRAAGAASSG